MDDKLNKTNDHRSEDQHNELAFDPTADQHFDCDMCEAILPEAVEGTLTDAEQAAVDRHVAGCVDCAAAMSEAQRGLAWLSMLKTHRPEPSAALLENILANTLGREAELTEPQLAVAGGEGLPAMPEPAAGWRVTMRRWWGDWTSPAGRGFSGLQPRLAMTTAMAFVSITVTLNLMGVSLRQIGELHLRDLRPATAQRLAGEAEASLMRQVQGNRVVYRLESRVNDLRDLAGVIREPQPQQ